jgi:hypothetical protein
LKALNGGVTPKYNAYRLYNSQSGGCNDIGEIALIGYEVIDDSNDEYSCPIEVIYKDGDTEEIASLPGSESVIFKVDKTPVVEGVSKRYLDVEGGEQLTITGRNL